MLKTLIILLVLTLIEIIVFHYYIKKLKSKQYTQSVRELGPRSHQIKSGTPTAGGIIFIAFLLIDFTTIKLLNKISFKLDDLILLIGIVLFGVLGYLDDIKIIKQKKNDGLTPSFKILAECVICIILFILMILNNYKHQLQINNKVIKLGVFSVFFVMFYIIGWSNSVNITDGLDGLASYLALSIFVGMFIIGKIEKNELLVISSLCMFFSVLGFLVFNFHPALVFMGNVGSHSLGAGIAICGLLTQTEIVLVVFGLLFIFETFSVILQVWYYKKTNGKRIFKMAPFHHHLELVGYQENSVSFIFLLISVLLVIIGVLLRGM